MGDKPKKVRKSPVVATTTTELFLLLILVTKVGAVVHQVS